MVISDLSFFEDTCEYGIFGGAYYGAFATSRSTDAYGYSYGYSTLEAAQNRALQECNQRTRTGDCVLRTSFRSESDFAPVEAEKSFNPSPT